MKKNKNKKNILLISLGNLIVVFGWLICVYGIADFILGRLGYANLTFFLGSFLSMFGPIICIVVGALVVGVGTVIKE